MVFIEKNKAECLVLHKVDKKIAIISLHKIFDCLSCVEEDAIWQLFEMKYLVNQVLRDIYIWTQDEYAKFNRKLSRLEVKKKVFLRFANVEKDGKKEGF